MKDQFKLDFVDLVNQRTAPALHGAPGSRRSVFRISKAFGKKATAVGHLGCALTAFALQ